MSALFDASASSLAEVDSVELTEQLAVVVIAALDVGTSRVKGALYEIEAGQAGQSVAQQRSRPVVVIEERMPPVESDGVRHVQDIAGIEAAVRSVLDGLQCVRAACKWAALALTTQRGTLIALDSDGRPCLSKMLSWLDKRGAAHNGDRWQWFRAASAHDDSVLPLLDAARVLTSLTGWLSVRLTGGPLVYDTAQTASAETLSADGGVRLVAPGQRIRVGASSPLGLPHGLALVLAGGDKNCDLLGAGVVEPTRCNLSLGTAFSFGALVAQPPAFDCSGVYVTASQVADYAQVEVGLPNGGGVWAWLQRTVGADGVLQSLDDGDLDGERPYFFPYLSGSLQQSLLSGAWLGLAPTTTTRQMAAAGLEGIVFDIRHGRNRLPIHFADVHVTGGGCANETLCRWLADALHLPVRVVHATEATIAGAAMVAAVSLGVTPSWRHAAELFALPADRVFLPRPHLQAGWDRRFAVWQQLLAKLPVVDDTTR